MLTHSGSGFLIGFGSGVVRWQPQGAATTIPALAGLDVRCLLQALDGSIWIGTENRGLLHWKPSQDPESSSSPETVIPEKSIKTLAEDHTGTIWAGTSYGGGVYRVTGKQVQNFGRSKASSPIVFTPSSSTKKVIFGSALGTG
jgi:ligand-binding sensor domain-containing protein